MRKENCPREVNVLTAIRRGIWEDALTAHVGECGICKEIAQVSRWMQDLAQSSEELGPPPGAGLLWRRAQLSEIEAKAERVQELLEWTEFVSAVIISVGLAGWIGWNWYAIESGITSFLTDTWPQFWITASSMANAAPFTLSLGASLFSLAVVALAYPFLARE